MTSSDVRDQLVSALAVDLIGPSEPHERLREVDAPSRYYLTGFLVPVDAPESERRDDDSDEALGGNIPDDEDDEPTDDGPKQPSFFPSSIGLSVLLQPGQGPLSVTARFGEYHLVSTGDPEHPDWQCWQRVPRALRITVPVRLDGVLETHSLGGLEGGDGVVVRVLARPVPRASQLGLPAGTRSVTLFLVNVRTTSAAQGRRNVESTKLFQAGLEVSAVDGFVRRPDHHGQALPDIDEQISDLQYRDVAEWAVGHGVATTIAAREGDAAHVIATTWLPLAEVARTDVGRPEQDAEGLKAASLEMDVLAGLPSGDACRDRLAWIAADYGVWLATQSTHLAEPDLQGGRRKVAAELLSRAERARARILSGLHRLASDPVAFEAFVLMNRAMAASARRRGMPKPGWRLFQLAFVLLNLDGLVVPDHDDRQVVDLLFFPTGGGKTEAYLGLAAFAMLHRRLVASPHEKIAAAGLTVLMRYTLRLLTLDQLGRAATLVCALELQRRADPEKLGTWPFEIGLWVGKKATPNEMSKQNDSRRETAKSWATDYKNPDRRVEKPIPIEACPWCSSRIGPDNFLLVDDRGRPDAKTPTNLEVHCLSERAACDFGGKALPIVAVDTVIYRRLPAFLIATADKIAALPWRGAAGRLFGAVDSFNAGGFGVGVGTPLPAPMPGPALIIQDELHLISGPLGTMAGLYEIAVEALSSRGQARPKIVASTATVRRADAQIRGLFGRDAEVFPPFGLDRRMSWFARTVEQVGGAAPGARRYVGVAAPGRSLKVVLLRTYLALLGSAARAAETDLAAADPYLTLLGYFNALRELGGARRIVEDEVRTRAGRLDGRRREGEESGLLARRDVNPDVLELTSRVSTADVAAAKADLAHPHPGPPATGRKAAEARKSKSGGKLAARVSPRVDVALATNMISVGLDITRLGLMVVLGQPKTASEYIQATSRVGRDPERPGLVVTLLNVYRPRDRSHFERFEYFHQTFYRAVEATSVTPFARRAIDRALPGVLATLVRHGVPALTDSEGAVLLPKHRAAAEAAAEALLRRAGVVSGPESETYLRAAIGDLLDAWARLAGFTQGGHPLAYWWGEAGMRESPSLLRTYLEIEPGTSPEQRKWRAQWSLRDVEPSSPILVENPPLGGQP